MPLWSLHLFLPAGAFLRLLPSSLVPDTSVSQPRDFSFFVFWLIPEKLKSVSI